MTDLEKKKIAFCDEILSMFFEWDCNGIEGGDFQDLAEKHGVIRAVPYDPQKHGDGPAEYDVEPGQEIFERTT